MLLNINIGVLGHVDSGKTSLVRSLSTLLSTAALDKNPQSQQRGITLDLGFSAFILPMPLHLQRSIQSESSLDGGADADAVVHDALQFTLVDCPGHASLIRTIIGGAQIIDMILLVVDANKGIQTQTAECIVIGEITTDSMIVVLNKIDSIPGSDADRAARLERVTNRIRKVLSATKFADAPIVQTSAIVGGEKSVSACSSGASTAGTKHPSPMGVGNSTHHHVGSSSSSSYSTFGLESLIDAIKARVKLPSRNDKLPFYYAIDHCFPVKGHGMYPTLRRRTSYELSVCLSFSFSF